MALPGHNRHNHSSVQETMATLIVSDAKVVVYEKRSKLFAIFGKYDYICNAQ